MELQSRFNIYLDYKGYQIEPLSYRAAPAPLMGTKFTTGRSAYSDMDFWQIGALTDFTKGMNQKYLVDPSMCYRSQGLYLGKPGELSLERNTVAFTGLPVGVGKITAHFRRTTDLYIGDALGNIMKSTNGTTFSIVYTVPDTNKRIYNFYQISGKLFATTGPGYIYVNESPDTGNTWTKEAISTQFPTPAYDATPTLGHLIHGSLKTAMTFKVPMGGNTFETLKVKVKKIGTPGGSLVISVYEQSLTVKGDPGTIVSGSTFTYTAGSVGTSYAWVELDITKFDLRAELIYYLVASTVGGDASNCYSWGYEEGSKATYDSGNSKTYDGSVWTDWPYQSQYFEFRRTTIMDLYYVMVESDYAFGWFSDGVRRSVDGYNWIPEPPDPLWVMSSGEGVPLNAVAIPKSFISGSARGLWAFVGGSSGLNLWSFPDYTSSNNFRGLERWGQFAVFSVEEQGLYYTDGSQVIPTTMVYLSEGFVFKSCKHIHSNGWDIYALISDNNSDWYLARTSLTYSSQPKYWWIVKKLAKEPERIVGWDDEKVFIFYTDTTAESFNKIGGPYVQEGYLETSWVDENLVKILKLYNSLNVVFSQFPGDGTAVNSTYAKLSYLINRQPDYINSSITYGHPNVTEKTYELPNPTLGNRIMIKLTIGRPAGTNTISPVVTDLTWKYILQQPSEFVKVKKSFTFTILAEDVIEDFMLDTQRQDEQNTETRLNILNKLYDTAAKKQMLNFIGADNKSEVGIEVDSNKLTREMRITVDRTNYAISIRWISDVDEFAGDANIGGGQNDYSYKGKTLTQVVTDLNALYPDLVFSVQRDQDPLRTAEDLEPFQNKLISQASNTYLMVGSDVHAVIMGINAPSQSKLLLDGRGSDRMQVSLREA